jgi:hypothetical protein
MKVSLVSVLCFGTGAILVYSGVKSYDPRDVIKWGLGGKKPKKMKSASGSEIEMDPRDHPDPGQRHPGDKNLPDPSGPTVPA